MTVYIEKPAVNLREELADLRNQGGYEEQQFWFQNFVTNGGFDADTNWTKSTGWTISGGVASHNGTGGGSQIDQSGILTAGRTYLLSFDLAVTSGSGVAFRPTKNSATVQIQFTTSGSKSLYFVSGDGGVTFAALASFVGTIDNISVSEGLNVSWDDSNSEVYRMPKGWVPKDVFEDGLLQREGTANDYEVVYDGFDYSVKPTVAPSATTQTCVIGVRK